MRRSLTMAALAAALLLGAACQTIRPTGAPSGRTPVVFVHGWTADETMWAPAVDAFRSAGYTSGDITVVYYDSALPARDAAAVLATEVDHLRSYTGRSKVDIVSHSYGSMVTRYCIELGGSAGEGGWVDFAFDSYTEVEAVLARLREAGAELYSWLQRGAHLYVCGDAEHMAPDVHAALLAIGQQHGGLDRDAAEAWLRRLVAARRYLRDVY